MFLILSFLTRSFKSLSQPNVTKVDKPSPKNLKSIKFLALGDSYTIGEGISKNENWPTQLSNLLKEKKINVQVLHILAATGWTTNDLLRSISNFSLEEKYELVTLLIGVNDQFQGSSENSYAIGFEKLILKAIQLAGGNPKRVIVISIPDYGVTQFGKQSFPAKIKAEIDGFNEINKNIAANKGVEYVNVTEISRLAGEDPTLIAADGLHPSAKMYFKWIKLIEPAAMNSIEVINNED